MKIISAIFLTTLSMIPIWSSIANTDSAGDKVDRHFLRNEEGHEGLNKRNLAVCPSTFAACKSRPTLKRTTAYNSQVVDLQCLLNTLNKARLTTDGYFGSLTDSAVRAWQTKKGLQVDGIVGCNTWKTLCQTATSSTTYTISPPSSFCPSDKCYWPSSSYISQITKTAFNSGVSTYRDLAKSNAATYSVHPAVLTTHMVLESSMGMNNNCVAINRKTKLTGCTWVPECSTTCTCSKSAVWSDQGQVSCTASTDKNAYNQAMTGQKVETDYYTKCFPYKYNADLMWNCIVCVYQGNFDKDITGKGGKYFTRDQTCAYAESFKTEFCGWKEYFSLN